MGYRIKKLKFKYAGHLCQGGIQKMGQNSSRIDSLKCKKGRPTTHWTDKIIEYMEPQWTKIAQSRRGMEIGDKRIVPILDGLDDMFHLTVYRTNQSCK